MIKKILIITGLILLIGTIIQSAQENPCEQEYLFLEFHYSNGELELINKTLETGCFSNLNNNENLEYTLFLKDKETITYSNSFNLNNLFIDGETESDLEGGMILLQETDFVITAPYLNGDRLEIYKEDSKIFEANIKTIGATSCRIK